MKNEIFLTNTLSRKKELFKPISKDMVGMYVCGLTVYDYAHIGNFRAYVFADILRRTLEFNGYQVKHVMNITDVGHLSSDEDDGIDKLEKGATREKLTVWEIAEHFTKAFINDLEQLNVLMPSIVCKATSHIQDIVSMVEVLEKKGFTYLSGGNVYFDTSKFADYGLLRGKKIIEEDNRARVDSDPNKKTSSDFVLWFTNYKYGSHAMEWDSPWGKGFPGWHIECSAMASKYLGEQFDVHTGGIDHVPIHHTNEIAQSEAAFGHKWVNYWIHNAFLVIGDDIKMSKSMGNSMRLSSLLEAGYDPMVCRIYLLSAQYSKPLAFSFEALDGAKTSLVRIRSRIRSLKKSNQGNINNEAFVDYLNEFKSVINNDLNTPRALAILWKTFDDQDLNPKTKLSLIIEYDKVFGLRLNNETTEVIPEYILNLAQERNEARSKKEWSRSDNIRKQIEDDGYVIRDTTDGFTISEK